MRTDIRNYSVKKEFKKNTIFQRHIYPYYRYRELFVLFIPVIFFFVIFRYLPMYGIVIAFKDYNLIYPKILLEGFPELANSTSVDYGTYKFSQGCNFHCNFCTESNWDLSVNNMDSIIDALKCFEDKGIKHIRFFNNNINFTVKWAEEFCDKIIQNNISIKWTDNANLTFTSPNMFKMLYEAGCIKLWYGTETISNRQLKVINKTARITHFEQSLQWAHEAGIWNQCNFITNFPHEDAGDVDDMIQFINDFHSKGFINGYVVNVFELRATSNYHVHPEKFGIEIVDGNHEMNFLIQYNEKGGKKWDEIFEEGKQKKLKITKNRNEIFRFL